MKKFRRRRKLIKPALQLRVVATFVALGILGVLLEAYLLSRSLAEPGADGRVLLSPALMRQVIRTLCLTLAVMVPVTVVVGVLVTFRIAGPLYRFENFLQEVARGERPAACHIRKRDELHGLCDLLNEATRPLREAPQARSETTEAAGSDNEPTMVA